MSVTKLPARTEGALWLLHLYGKPATAKELRDKNKKIFPGDGQGVANMDPEYLRVHDIMYGNGIGETNPFWFADGIMYGLEQAFLGGYVTLDNLQTELVVEEEFRFFLKQKRKQKALQVPFRRSRVRYKLSGLGYMWITDREREIRESQG